jgi:large subunit ribosomal protein L25
MKSITIKGSKRESVGKKATKALRNAGQVPCVLYGGEEPMHFAADESEFRDLFYTPDVYTVVIELADGTTFRAVPQDTQWHPVREQLLHVDFYQIFDDKPITLGIPVRTVGTSRGVLNGGVLRKNQRKLRVKALPDNLPDFIEIDITKMKIGDKKYVSDIPTDNFEIMHLPHVVVCMIKTSRLAVEVEEDEDETDADEVPATEQGESQASVAAED